MKKKHIRRITITQVIETTPAPAPRKRAGRPRHTPLSPNRFAVAIAAGENEALLVAEAGAAIAEFFRASTMTVDAQRMVLEMLLDEVDDAIADDSVSWSESRAPVFDGLGRRAG